MPKRRRRARRVAVGLFAVGAVALVAVTGVDALQARDHLLEARAAVSAARDSLADRDLEGAVAELDRAGDLLEQAADRAEQPGWRTLQAVPLLGRSLQQVADTVEVGRAAVVVGAEAIDRVKPLLGAGGQGGLDTGQLALTAESLAEVSTSALAVALANLESRPSSWVMSQVQEARVDVTDGAKEALHLLEEAHDLLSTFSTFLGEQEPRTYFLAMQNPAELRGTGGFLGFFAILTIDQGHFELAEPTVYGDLTEDEAQEPQSAHLELAAAEFEARYAHAAASTFLANANVDPDVPTSAEVILDIYERSTGDRLDGLIMVDPFVLAGILDVVGPVSVAEEFQPSAPGLPRQLRGADVAQAIMVDEYDVFGGNNPARKRWLREVATASFGALFDREWAVADLAERLRGLAGRGHLQLYSRDAAEQQVIRGTRMAGTLRHAPGEDLLAVTANNAAANKADVHVAHRSTLDVRLYLATTGTFMRSSDLRVEVENPLPTSGRDPYIIGSSPVGESSTSGPTGLPGLVRTWFSVWMPPDVEVLEMTGAEGDTLGIRTFDIHDTRVVDHVLETPSMATTGFVTRWDGPAHVGTTDETFEYRLRWRRQTKGIADRLDLRIAVPSGFAVQGVELEGAPSVAMFGLDGAADPRPVIGRPSSTVVTVQGDVTQDLVVVVRFVRV